MALRSLRAFTGPLRVLAASRSAAIPVVRAAPRLSTSLAPRVALGATRAFSFTPRALGSGESKYFKNNMSSMAEEILVLNIFQFFLSRRFAGRNLGS